MSQRVIIFGAGKTGRGFAAHLAHLSDHVITFVDKDETLVSNLNRAGEYRIEVLGNHSMNCTIPVTRAYSLNDEGWHHDFIAADLVFTAVFGNNLDCLAKYLARAIQFRSEAKSSKVLNIITLENLTNAAGFLKQSCLQYLSVEKQEYLNEMIGFSESIVFKTCLNAAEDQPALTVRAQDLFYLPCDGDRLKGEVQLYGLQPTTNFQHQLKRKIFTYNCVNAVFAYLGARKGYVQLSEAANDQEIIAVAAQAGHESCKAQVAEFGFDPDEQAQWLSNALKKFADRDVPDPIDRNAVDPVRKLGRDDRLIGPALLAMKHNIYPEALIKTVMACFKYRDPGTNTCVADLISSRGVENVLHDICGLTETDSLFPVLHDQIKNTLPDAA